MSIDEDKLSQLQINLMMSHACGEGDRVPTDVVRLMIFFKIQSLSYGYSGIKLDTVERLIEFFNHGVCPVVYQQGSVGCLWRPRAAGSPLSAARRPRPCRV